MSPKCASGLGLAKNLSLTLAFPRYAVNGLGQCIAGIDRMRVLGELDPPSAPFSGRPLNPRDLTRLTRFRTR